MAAPLRYWTQLLQPGRYRLSDGRTVEYTRSDCKNAMVQGNRMLSAGLRAPVCWMHDPEAEPAYLSATKQATGAPDAWMAKGFVGEPVKYRLARDGSVEGLLNFHDEKDAEQFRRVGAVSPRVDFDWTDERGKTWKGCTISHVAVTPRPIQRGLSKPHPAYPSDYFAHGATPGRSRLTHYLGHATKLEGDAMGGSPEEEEELPEAEAGADPAMPEAAAGGGGEALPEGAPAEGGDIVPEADEAAAIPEAEPEPDPALTTGSDPLPRLVAALAKLGIKVGEAKHIDDLASRVEAIAEHTGGTPDLDDPSATELESDEVAGKSPNAPDAKGNIESAPMPPALMAHYTKAANVESATIEKRIQKLFRNSVIDGAYQRDLIGELKKAPLSHESFNTDGSLRPFPLLIKLEALERLPAGPFARRKPANLSHGRGETETVRPPEELTKQARIDAEVADTKKRILGK